MVTLHAVDLLHVYAQPSSGRDDVIAFVTGNTADYKRSDPIADMAIRWAQERREKIEVSTNKLLGHHTLAKRTGGCLLYTFLAFFSRPMYCID